MELKHFKDTSPTKKDLPPLSYLKAEKIKQPKSGSSMYMSIPVPVCSLLL